MLPHLPRLPEVTALVRGEESEPLAERHLEPAGDRRRQPDPAEVEAVGRDHPPDDLVLELEEAGRDRGKRLVGGRDVRLRRADADPRRRLHEADVETPEERVPVGSLSAQALLRRFRDLVVELRKDPPSVVQVVETLRDRPTARRRSPVELGVCEAVHELLRVGARVAQLPAVLRELGVQNARNDACRAHFLKYCTARSWRSAASRVRNVPRFRRRPVFGSFFRE